MKYSNIIYKTISYFIIFAFCTTPSSFLVAQETQKKGLISKFREKITEKIPSAIAIAASKVTASLKEKLQKISKTGAPIIFSRLKSNLDTFQEKIMYVSQCMLRGDCTVQERAAFITTAITILALTLALIGVTATLATISKQVDEKVVEVSGQVKGWKPRDIFNRLQATTSRLKQNILNMENCLIKRECTKAQKNILYATAGTLAALATIAVGVGIGAFIYSEYKRSKQPTELPKVEDIDEDKPIIEQPALGEFISQTSWKSNFMKNMAASIKATPALFKEAYDKIKEGIQQGIITTKEQAYNLFEKAALQATDFKTLVQSTFHINLANTLNQLGKISNKYDEFKEKLDQSFAGQLASLGNQINTLVSILKPISKDMLNIYNAFDERGFKPIDFIKAELERPETMRKKLQEKQAALQQLATQKTALEKEREEFYAQAAQVEPSGSVKKTGKKIFTGKKKNDLSSQAISNTLKEFERRSQEVHEKEKNTRQAIQKLEDKLEVRKIISSSYLSKTYAVLLEQLYNLNLQPIGTIIQEGFGTLATIMSDLASPEQLSGKLGAIVIPQIIRPDLQKLAANIRDIGEGIKNVINIKPFITAPIVKGQTIPEKTSSNVPIISRTDLVKGIIKATRKENIEIIKKAIDDGPNLIKKILQIKEPILAFKKSAKSLKSALVKFVPNMKDLFQNTIKKAPIRNIPRATIILMQELGKQTQITKLKLIQTIEATTTLLEAIYKGDTGLAENAYRFTRDINNFFQLITNHPFINRAFLENLYELLNTKVREMQETINVMQKKLNEEEKIAREPIMEVSSPG